MDRNERRAICRPSRSPDDWHGRATTPRVNNNPIVHGDACFRRTLRIVTRQPHPPVILPVLVIPKTTTRTNVSSKYVSLLRTYRNVAYRFVRFRLTAHRNCWGGCAIRTERNFAWEPRPPDGNARDRTKRDILNSSRRTSRHLRTILRNLNDLFRRSKG